jgi:hypothetical protein
MIHPAKVAINWSGCKFTGEKLGVKRVPHVKGQCLVAYDPGCLKALE